MPHPRDRTQRNLNALQRLRERSQNRAKAPAAAPTFRTLANNLKQQATRTAGAGDAWRSTCPPQLLDRTHIISLSRGILTVGVTDAATNYELTRFLNAGGLDRLAAKTPATLRRVKLVSHTPTTERRNQTQTQTHGER